MTTKKRILLAVSGMTPQIITETLYGIYIKDKTQLPQHVQIISTQDGKQRLINNLLGADSPLKQMIRDYKMPDIAFSEDDIMVPHGDDGQPLYDVKTEREQEIITDFITNHVRQLSINEDCSIHASLAGGRKTMGFALGYAMSLFGRPQDCLSHVLVSEPYERVPDFYYPTPTTVNRADRDKNTQHDLSMAKVTLANIPLVLMRQEIPTQLMTSSHISYTQTVERINRANQLNQQTAVVKLDFERMSILCNDQEITLTPACFAFYSWLAQDSKEAPGEGIDSPKNDMKLKELDQRLQDFITACMTPGTIANPIPLTELLDLATDEINRRIKHKRTGDPDIKTRHSWLLKVGGSNENLLDQNIERNPADVHRWHKNIWDRLLKSTNDTIEKELGKKLASHYKIFTVSEVKKGKHKFAYKGLNLLPDNIQW